MPTRYWPYFCEENVWHLCADERVGRDGIPIPIENRRVVFISNARRRVEMRKQRAGGDAPILWDYHVVLLADGRVWDPDSTLDLPVGLDEWLRESFQGSGTDVAPRFRVIDAPVYRREFASDRSHMRGPDGQPLKPFPPWPPIGVGMNLPRFINLETPFLGEVVDLQGFRRFS